MDDVDKLVDEVFDGGFHNLKRLRKVDREVDMLLDGTISTSGRPYDHPLKMKITATPEGTAEVDVDECAGPMQNEYEDSDADADENFEGSEYDEGPSRNDDPDKEANDINHVPNQKVGGLLKSVHDELTEGFVWRMIAEMRKDGNYKQYFKSMLDKYGYDSIKDIPDDKKKKEFFNAVDKGWKAANEQFIRRGDDRQQGGFASIRGTSTQGGFGSIKGTQQQGGHASIKGYGPKKEEDEIEEDEVEEYIERPKPDRAQGGFGRIAGTQTRGGFGSIKGYKREEDELEEYGDE